MVQKIACEMAASVLRVEVEVGAQIVQGDTLMVLESMKMEIPVTSQDSGTVSALHVEEGDAVSEGDLLVEIN